MFVVITALTSALVVGPAVVHAADGPGTVKEFGLSFFGHPTGIVAGPDGNLWVTERTANKIAKVTPDGAITEFDVPTSGSGPEQITVGPDANVWFTEQDASQVAKVTTAGVFTEYPVPTSGSGPEGIVSGPDGNVWFTENFANQVAAVTPAGVVAEYAVPTAFSGPEAITAGPDGNLWFTESIGDNVARLTTAGVVTEFAIPTAFSVPAGIAAGPDGNLWVAESSGQTVAKVTTAGTITEFLTPLANPQDITTGPNDTLWITDPGRNRVDKMTPGGSFTEFELHSVNALPLGIAEGADGNMWFAEANVDKVAKVGTGAPGPAGCTDLTGTTPPSPLVLDGTECGLLQIDSPTTVSGTIGPHLVVQLADAITLTDDLTNHGTIDLEFPNFDQFFITCTKLIDLGGHTLDNATNGSLTAGQQSACATMENGSFLNEGNVHVDGSTEFDLNNVDSTLRGVIDIGGDISTFHQGSFRQHGGVQKWGMTVSPTSDRVLAGVDGGTVQFLPSASGPVLITQASGHVVSADGGPVVIPEGLDLSVEQAATFPAAGIDNFGTFRLESVAGIGTGDFNELINLDLQGGTLTNFGTLIFGFPTGGPSGFDVSRAINGKIVNKGTLQVGAHAAVTLGDGEHVLDAGSTMNVDGSVDLGGTLTMKEGAKITGNGAINLTGELHGAIDIAGTTTISSGVVAGLLSPGFSPHTAHFGSLNLASDATTLIELAGPNPGSQYDNIIVDGSAFLNGSTLEVALLNGFVPSACQVFHILDAGTTENFFGAFAGLDLPGPLKLAVFQDHVNGVDLVAVDDSAPITAAPAALSLPEGASAPITACLSATPSAPLTYSTASSAPVLTTAPSLPVGPARASTFTVSSLDDTVPEPDALRTVVVIAHAKGDPIDGQGVVVPVTIVDNDPAVPPPALNAVAPAALAAQDTTTTTTSPASSGAPPRATATPPVANAPSAGASSPGAPAAASEQNGHTRAALPASLPTPADLDFSARSLLTSALLAMLLVLLLLFPADLFNNTLEEHYDEITAGLDRWRVRFGGARNRVSSLPGYFKALLMCALGGFMCVFLDPQSAFDPASISFGLGMTGALAILIVVYQLPVKVLLQRLGHVGAFGAFPAAAVGGIVFVLVSRAASFQPGFAFGLIAGWAFSTTNEREEGRSIAAGALIMLGCSLLAWMAWAALPLDVTSAHPSFGALFFDSLLACTFVAGIEGLVFGMVPIKYFDGDTVRKWSRAAHLALLSTGMFVFVHVLIGGTNYIGKSNTVSAGAVAVTFAAFASFSVSFFAYWRARETRGRRLLFP